MVEFAHHYVPAHERASRRWLSNNDEDLDYLYDYEEDYDDSDYDRNRKSDGFLVDLPIVNQRENGVEFFPTPSSTDNRRKSTTLTAR